MAEAIKSTSNEALISPFTQITRVCLLTVCVKLLDELYSAKAEHENNDDCYDDGK